MVDWAKRIHKHSGGELFAGEQIEAGTVVQPSGTLGRQVGFGVGGVVGAIAAEKMASRSETGGADGGTAAAFPKSQTVLGLSMHRLMAFAHGSMSGKPKEMLAAVPLAEVASMNIEKRKLSYTLSIGFGDGTGVTYEAVKMAKPAEFAATFERLRA